MSDIALGTAQPEVEPINAAALRQPSQLARVSGWYGVWWVIATEGSLFIYLLFSYFYCLFQAGVKWPVGGPPSLALPLLSTIVLLGSSAALGWSQWSLLKAPKPRLFEGVGLACVLGVVFLALQSYDLWQKAPGLSSNTYNSFYVLLTGLDVLHAGAGVIALAALAMWINGGRIVGIRTTYVSIIAAYWHFIVVVWLAIFASMSLLPYVR